jgi:hypothetical protein
VLRPLYPALSRFACALNLDSEHSHETLVRMLVIGQLDLPPSLLSGQSCWYVHVRAHGKGYCLIAEPRAGCTSAALRGVELYVFHCNMCHALSDGREMANFLTDT